VVFIRKKIKFYIDDKSKKNIIERLRTAGCVFAEEEAQLLISKATTLDVLSNCRITGEPLEQILVWAEYYGVDAGVFAPRRRTEYFVQEAIVF
jgi:release factor glutamine methyltransferase